MRRLILFILFPLFLFAQGEKKITSIPAYTFPFIAGNDTILSAANLHSAVFILGKLEGVVKLGIQSDTMANGGTVAKDIDVYWKERLSGLDWGVPSDSIAVDSIFLGTIDSAYVNDETPWYLDLSGLPWWSITDEGKLILDPGASADSIRIKCRIRGY